MGEYEDKVRAAIKEKYGSVPKMAEMVGIAPTTIYHALDRGIEGWEPYRLAGVSPCACKRNANADTKKNPRKPEPAGDDGCNC